MFYTALVRSWYGLGLTLPPLRPGFVAIIRKNRDDWFVSVVCAFDFSGLLSISSWLVGDVIAEILGVGDKLAVGGLHGDVGMNHITCPMLGDVVLLRSG